MMRPLQGSGVSITIEGKRHLRVALGSPSFVDSFVERRVSTWNIIHLLSDISVTHPHATYVVL